MFRWEAYTRWGASDQFNEPDQTRGQELYGEPAWIGNGLLMVTDLGALLTKQVAVYRVGGGDNSLTEWFSDPDNSVKELHVGAVAPTGDKLAFVATTAGPQDQIRLYTTNGSIPNPPTFQCAMTGAVGGRFAYPTFSPDGQTLAWVEGDGIHAGSVTNLGDCSTISNSLVIPGATQPYFGPADFNSANAPSPPTSTRGSASGPSPTTCAGGRGVAGAGSPSSGAPAAVHGQGHGKRRRRHSRPRHARRHGHAATLAVARTRDPGKPGRSARKRSPSAPLPAATCDSPSPSALHTFAGVRTRQTRTRRTVKGEARCSPR